MHLRCGEIFNLFTAETDGERILKIDQHLAKLWARVDCPVYWLIGIGLFADSFKCGGSRGYGYADVCLSFFTLSFIGLMCLNVWWYTLSQRSCSSTYYVPVCSVFNDLQAAAAFCCSSSADSTVSPSVRMTWNSLPAQPRCSEDSTASFGRLLKTLLCSENWRSLFSALEVSATNVPYESTIYVTLQLYRFRDMLRYWSRIANLSHPTYTWRPRWGYCRRNCVASIRLRNLKWWT